jgi:hypothetical protein
MGANKGERMKKEERRELNRLLQQRKLERAETERVVREKMHRAANGAITDGRIFGFWAGKSDLGRMATPAGELRKSFQSGPDAAKE